MEIFYSVWKRQGGVPEWSKGTDCKSVGEAFGGSNPPPTTTKRSLQNSKLSQSKSYVGDFGLISGSIMDCMASCIIFTYCVFWGNLLLLFLSIKFESDTEIGQKVAFCKGLWAGVAQLVEL